MSIFELIENGDLAGVQRLLAEDPSAAEARDDQGLSPIVRAVYRDHADIAAALPPLDAWDRLLIGESTDLPAPDAWSPDGFTALHLAAYVHNVAAAEALLAQGADPNAMARASFARVTPLGTCRFVGADDVARVLIAHGADPALIEEESG